MAESSYLENLGKSLVWNSTLGLFGLEAPDEDLQEWQAENPKMALASEILPLGFGTAKAMSALAKGTNTVPGLKVLVGLRNLLSTRSLVELHRKLP